MAVIKSLRDAVLGTDVSSAIQEASLDRVKANQPHNAVFDAARAGENVLNELDANLINLGDVGGEEEAIQSTAGGPITPMWALAGGSGGAAAGRQSPHFPTLGQPIQQGVYQGSIVGSVPIFAAPGAVFPREVIANRMAALQSMAEAQAKRKQENLKLKFKNASTYHQQQSNEYGFRLIESTLEEEGGATAIINDPQKRNKALTKWENFTSTQARTATIQAKIEEILKAPSDKKYISADTKRAIERFSTTTFDQFMENPKILDGIETNIVSFENLRGVLDNIFQETEFDTIAVSLKDSLDEISAVALNEAINTFRNNDDYAAFGWGLIKTLLPERAEAIIESVLETANLAPEHQNEDFIGRQIAARIPQIHDIKTTAIRKSDKGSGSGTPKDKTLGIIGTIDKMFFPEPAKVDPDLQQRIAQTDKVGDFIEVISAHSGLQFGWNASTGSISAGINVPTTGVSEVKAPASFFNQIQFDGAFRSVSEVVKIVADKMMNFGRELEGVGGSVSAVKTQVDKRMEELKDNFTWDKLRDKLRDDYKKDPNQEAIMNYADAYIQSVYFDPAAGYGFGDWQATSFEVRVVQKLPGVTGAGNTSGGITNRLADQMPRYRNLTLAEINAMPQKRLGVDFDLVYVETFTPVSKNVDFFSHSVKGKSVERSVMTSDVNVVETEGRGQAVRIYPLGSPQYYWSTLADGQQTAASSAARQSGTSNR